MIRPSLFVATILALHIQAGVAQEGGPQIGRAAQELETNLKEGDVNNLTSKIRSCYDELVPGSSGADKVAYCFGLDYIANRLLAAGTASFDADAQRYLTIEKVLTRANRALEARKIEQAERGPLIAFWVKSSLTMLKSRTNSKDRGMTESAAKLDLAKSAVLKLVRDAPRARVFGLKHSITPNVRGEPTEVVCGTVSEGTAAGKYSRPNPFVYFVSERKAHYANGAEDDLDKQIINNFCVKS